MRKPTCTVEIVKTGYDNYGQETELSRHFAKCHIVTMNLNIDKTYVRTDSSASRGSAEEATADVRLLFPPETKIEHNDTVKIMNQRLRVVGVFPRPKLYGGIDHLQVELERAT
ncbi:hypothetical protein [Chitinibacter tainanensis]|uniref:hypothetical protein n=1 Tax=Chitinibacter tainanensis TaxID=230667 RepID=UPI00068765DA|nr:hypothetical protein [Chitinibacter tainanensis]